MQPNILLLVAFAEINASCSCPLVEDIKKWTVNLKNSIDKPIYFLTNVKTLKWWCFHRRPHIRRVQINKSLTDKRECKSFSVNNRSFPASLPVKPNCVQKANMFIYTDGLTSPLARQSTMCVRKKWKQLFYGVRESSSSSPEAPGIKVDFTPDRNKHFKKWPTFKLLRFRRTLVTFISQQYACTTPSHNMSPLSLFSYF